MICPNCKKHVDNNAKFCGECGEQLTKVEKPNSNASQFSYSEIYSNINSYKVTSDEDYLKYFIGNSYENVKLGKFSFSAFIFGPFKLLYRKMYLYGISLLCIFMLLLYYNSEIGILCYIIFNLYLGLKYNTIYMNYVTQKVDIIKMSNPDKSSTELLEVCRKKGNHMNVLLLILFVLTVIFIIITTMFEYKSNTKETKEPKKENPTSMYDMNYKMLDNYKLGRYQSNFYAFYSYHKDDAECYIILKTSNKKGLYKTINEYMSTNEKSEFTDVNINDNTWKKLIFNEDITLYGIEYNDKYYLIKFDSNDQLCKNNEDEFMNTINFKRTN